MINCNVRVKPGLQSPAQGWVPINASPLFIQNRLRIIGSERAFNLFKCQLLPWPQIEEQLLAQEFFIERDFPLLAINKSSGRWWMETILIWSVHFNQVIIGWNCPKFLSGLGPPPAWSLIFIPNPRSGPGCPRPWPRLNQFCLFWDFPNSMRLAPPSSGAGQISHMDKH